MHLRFHSFFRAAQLMAVALVASAAVMLAGPATLAIAQEVESTRVDLSPVATGLVGYVSAGVSAVLAIGIGIVSTRLYSWLGITIEARHREALHSAIMTGVNAGLSRVADLIGGQAIDVRSTAVAEAVNYVVRSVPDAVKFFDLSEARIGEMVAAKLTQLQSGGKLDAQIPTG